MTIRPDQAWGWQLLSVKLEKKRWRCIARIGMFKV